MFSGRKIVIATMHHKEQVIQPILESNLGCTCVVPNNFNTDLLGTFSGEIERNEDPIVTARKKCELAMRLTNTNIAVASEGSFGPHPSYFFASADDEFLMLKDIKNDLEIIVRELTLETNLNGDYINSIEELERFASKAKFPGHALIIRKSKDDSSKIVKGITTWKKLYACFNRYISLYGTVYVETDMRAMHNPTRMEVIRNLTLKLVDKINSTCPTCSTPGFGVTEVRQGLPCQQCGFPTGSTKSHIYTCVKCSYTEEKKYPNNKQTEDPMYCDICNP